MFIMTKKTKKKKQRIFPELICLTLFCFQISGGKNVYRKLGNNLLFLKHINPDEF